MTTQTRNRLIILGIFALTILPFIVAVGLKLNPDLLNKKKTNYGQLITPPIPTERADFVGFDEFSRNNLHELPGHWLIANVIPQEHCNEVCLEALLKTRQLRLMLNKELMRTRRVALLFKNVPAKSAEQWWLKATLLWRLQNPELPPEETVRNDNLYRSLLKEDAVMDDKLIDSLIKNENREFALNSDLIRIMPNEEIKNKITTINKGEVQEGTLLLIDPLGNIMMHYETGFDPYKVKNDLMHLLRISQLG